MRLVRMLLASKIKLQISLLMLGISIALAWSIQAQEQESGDRVVELQGSAGDTVRVVLPVFCIEYDKPGPESHTTLSVYPQPVQEKVQRILQIAQALRGDPQARFLMLMHSPVYADILRNYSLPMWLMESDTIEAKIKELLRVRQRLDAYQRLGHVLLGEEALNRATQRAIWAVTCDVTPQQLLEDARKAAKTPQERIVADLDILFLLPYVQILLSEAQTDQKWTLPGGDWMPPVENEVSYPVVEVLLNYTSLPNILKSADECFRTNRWESAAFYYRHALSRPHPQALTPYLCLQLACTYDRLYQQYPAPDLEKWRRYSLEILNRNSSASIALLEGDNPPDFTKVPSDDIEKQLRQAEMALARIEYNTAAILARQVIESSSSTPDTCHALRLLAYACLAMGEVKEAHQALTKLVDKANAAEPSERETFGLDILADEANLILERLQVQHEYECLYKDAMERVRNGDLQEGVRLLQRAAGILPKCPSVHYLLGNLYAQLGQQEKAKEHWDRALKLCAFDKLPKME